MVGPSLLPGSAPVQAAPEERIRKRSSARGNALVVATFLLSAGPFAAAALSAENPASSAIELNNRGVQAAQAGRFEEGIGLLRRALQADPAYAAARKNLSGILTDWAVQLEHQGRFEEAMDSLQEALASDPNNGLASVRLGDLFYRKRSDFSSAIRFWRSAHGHVPAAAWPAIAERIAQAGRDERLEKGFISHETPHFEIRFQESSDADPEWLGKILEEAHAQFSQELDLAPSSITVLVYTGQELRSVFGRRDWALGLYDGRIRLSLGEVTAESLHDMIAHEVAHAFLHYGYGDRLPIWVHEGYAQFHERMRPRQEGEALRIAEGVASRAMWVPLRWLDRHFEQPTGTEDIVRSYEEARQVVDQLIGRHGIERFKRFLSALSKGTETAAAFDQAFAPARWAQADQGLFE